MSLRLRRRKNKGDVKKKKNHQLGEKLTSAPLLNGE